MKNSARFISGQRFIWHLFHLPTHALPRHSRGCPGATTLWVIPLSSRFRPGYERWHLRCSVLSRQLCKSYSSSTPSFWSLSRRASLRWRQSVGTPPRWNGRRRKRPRTRQLGTRAYPWFTAGPTTTACRAWRRTSFRKPCTPEDVPTSDDAPATPKARLNEPVPQTITVKPWLQHRGEHGRDLNAGEATLASTAGAHRVAACSWSWLTSFFLLFMVAYYTRMELEDWGRSPSQKSAVGQYRGSDPAQQHGATVRAAMRCKTAARSKTASQLAAGRRPPDSSHSWCGQWIWPGNSWCAAGYYARANPANAFFYLLTAVHGCTWLGGIGGHGSAGIRAEPYARGSGALPGAPLSVDFVRHLLALPALVWLVLFMLLIT